MGRRAVMGLVACAGALAGVACEEQSVSEQGNSASEASSMVSQEGDGSSSGAAPLSAALEERYAGYQQRADEETKRIYKAGIEAVAASGVLDEAKNVGDAAPAFTLPDASGDPVALGDLLDDGAVVLVWYRGGWCPYCNLTLRAYAEIAGEIEAAGGRLVAVSPELPDETAETVEKNGLDYTVLSDVGNVVAKEYGVVFSLTPEVHAKYNEGFGFDAHNGQDSGELPLAATYVIDREGVIRYAFLDADYTKRGEPAAALEALRALP